MDEGNTTKRFHADDVHKVLFCGIPKVSSTVWKRTMMILGSNDSEREILATNPRKSIPRNPSKFAHDARIQRRFGLLNYNVYTEEERQFRLHNYYKFIFVRNPFSRLLSAYLDKFTIHDYSRKVPYEKHALDILGRYRRLGNPNLALVDIDVTFSEFLHYVVDIWQEEHSADRHWRPYYKYCRPCTTEYDFIGHMETFNEDASYILQHVYNNSMDISQFMNSNLGPCNKKSTEKAVAGYYSQIDENLLAKIREYIMSDARIFGYDMNQEFVS